MRLSGIAARSNRGNDFADHS